MTLLLDGIFLRFDLGIQQTLDASRNVDITKILNGLLTWLRYEVRKIIVVNSLRHDILIL